MAAPGSPTALGVEVQPQWRNGTTLVTITGDLDALSVSRLRETLADLPGDGDAVFDLSAVPFIDSAGLGALIAGVRRVREGGGRVGVVSSRPNIVRLLRVTGFDRIAPVHESLDAAVA